MKDYHDLYLKCDVLWIADIFEKFRNSSLRKYGLCPSHYLSGMQCLIWQKVEIKLFLAPDMYIFFEKGMRGGVSCICNRYSYANNK